MSVKRLQTNKPKYINKLKKINLHKWSFAAITWLSLKVFIIGSNVKSNSSFCGKKYNYIKNVLLDQKRKFLSFFLIYCTEHSNNINLSRFAEFNCWIIQISKNLDSMSIFNTNPSKHYLFVETLAFKLLFLEIRVYMSQLHRLIRYGYFRRLVQTWMSRGSLTWSTSGGKGAVRIS